MELNEYFAVIRKRLWLIALTVVAACAATGAASLYLIEPVYTASTKLVVTNTNQYPSGIVALDLTTLSSQIKLANTYKELITTAAVLDRVAEQYPSLGLTSGQLGQQIKVSSVSDSQILTLTALAPSHNLAVQIVNAVAELSKTEISKIMKIDNITIVNPAKHADAPVPVKPNIQLNVVMAFVVSCLMAFGTAFLLEAADDSIRNEKDIAKHIGLPVLATVQRIAKKEVGRGQVATNDSISRKAGEVTYAGVNQ